MYAYYFLVALSICVVYVELGLSQNNEEMTGLSPEVSALSSSFFDWRMKSLPQFATFIGISEYNEYLDDLSEDAYLARYEESNKFLQKVVEIQPTLTNEADIQTMQILKNEIETFIKGFQYKGFYLSMNNMEGPHTDIGNLLEWMPKNNLADFEVILTRMRKIPTQLDQMITLMKKGVDSGITYHNVSMNGLTESLANFIVQNAEDSPLYSPFTEDFPSNMSEDEIKDIKAKAKQLTENEIASAYQKLSNYISNEYVTRKDIAATSLPNGQEYYNQLIRFHTSTNMTAEEIQKIGYSEVDAIEEKMMEVIREAGYENMSVDEFSQKLRNDPNNFYNSSEELMKRFEEINFEIIPPRLPEIFEYAPQTELNIVAKPSLSGPGAFYLTGSYDGSRPGVFYVNTFNLKSQPKYAMMSLSLHEGSPGHHLQGSYQMESTTMPFFRKKVDDRNYAHTPSSYPMHTGYAEGWGLYSEGLGFDMNLYDDPLDRYGHYSEEIFRACRLVVDTGMHAFGWSREEAIEYMYEHTASTRAEIEREIDRYITWPGQALAYKIGQIKIRNLRSHAEGTLGDSFDIRQFHEVVLAAVGPLSLLEESVNKWVDSVSGTK